MEEINAKRFKQQNFPQTLTVHGGKSIRLAKYIDMSIKLTTSIFFIYTGVFKITNIDSFRLNVIKTGVFSEEIIFFMPYVLSVIELSIAALIIVHDTIGNILFGSLMLLFSFYITYLYNNDLYEVCGCGGILNGLSYSYHMLINIAFIMVSFISICIQFLKSREKLIDES